MSQTAGFYEERADQAAADAAGAELLNVRERHLRAEKTWRDLAEHARKVSDRRAALAQKDADRRDAARAEAG